MISQNLVQFTVAHHGGPVRPDSGKEGQPNHIPWGPEGDQGDSARPRFRSREFAPGTWAAMKEDRGLFWSARKEKANVLWPVPRARLLAQSCRDDTNQDGTGTYTATAGSAWTVSRETGGLSHTAQGGDVGILLGATGAERIRCVRQPHDNAWGSGLGMERDRSNHQGVQPGTTPRAGGSPRTDLPRSDWPRRE